MVKSVIFTKRELEVIHRKMNNTKLNQTDSNYLSRFIRPKLKEIGSLDAKYLLDKMEYNQKIKSIENKIKKIILSSLNDVDSIILYGSVIQNNYKNYNDIDIMIVTKSKIYKKEIDKYKKIKEIKNILKDNSIVSDIEIISKENLIKSYKNSPTLIYELKDHKVIYGDIKIPKKIELYNIDLHMKLDWSDIYDPRPSGKEIYSALRNTLVVRLLLSKIIDNKRLKESLYEELGKNLIERLKNNKQSNEEKRYALHYLKNLIEDTRKQIRGGLWEKTQLLK
ncbi:nucleotidyltransferase domain-containing protein [Candidatus Pacearchaeota archaeon]|nr:nucleotidyltransferase domain-containing protein [Candidatus Pacearchaeota archaeon]